MADSPELLEAERTRTAADRHAQAAFSTTYEVQTINAASPSHPSWSPVSSWAFRDNRTGGKFDANPDNAALVKHPSRTSREAFVFTDMEPALAIAALLNEHGGFMSEHEGRPWNRPDRPAVCRVVRVETARAQRVVQPDGLVDVGDSVRVLTPWELSRLSSWSSGNALTYLSHYDGAGLKESEIPDLNGWLALADKLAGRPSREPLPYVGTRAERRSRGEL